MDNTEDKQVAPNSTDKESVRFDCFRGCTVSRDDATGELECEYRPGCCKLEVYDWLSGVKQEQFNNLFEVRFKNTRKGIFINGSGQTIKTGDLVIVEAANGHDLGIVTLEGPIVKRQMLAKGVPAEGEFKKIYRKAKSFDIEKWQEAIAREQEVMIESRKIAADMQLDMKIGDVEFQGDGTKAIFYYIADGRVDFRQLIKVFAEEFRIRIEMKQIGARQEAGLIGGLGICGRELCCANNVTSFQSITTSAAKVQDLSLNPQKLAGQCGKLKCCLNYEVAAYLDAQSRIPKVFDPLQFQDGEAYLMKTDILQETMYFSYDKASLAELFPLKASEVKEILSQNRQGIKPETLKQESIPDAPEFVTAVGDDSISRFDEARKKRGNKKRRGNRPPQAGAPSSRPQARPSQSGPQGGAPSPRPSGPQGGAPSPRPSGPQGGAPSPRPQGRPAQQGPQGQAQSTGAQARPSQSGSQAPSQRPSGPNVPQSGAQTPSQNPSAGAAPTSKPTDN